MNCTRCGKPIELVYPEGTRFAFFADADGEKHWKRCPPKERPPYRPVPEPPALDLDRIAERVAAHFAATAIRVLAQTARARGVPVRAGAAPAGLPPSPAPAPKPAEPRPSMAEQLGL